MGVEDKVHSLFLDYCRLVLLAVGQTVACVDGVVDTDSAVVTGGMIAVVEVGDTVAVVADMLAAVAEVLGRQGYISGEGL